MTKVEWPECDIAHVWSGARDADVIAKYYSKDILNFDDRIRTFFYDPGRNMGQEVMPSLMFLRAKKALWPTMGSQERETIVIDFEQDKELQRFQVGGMACHEQSN